MIVIILLVVVIAVVLLTKGLGFNLDYTRGANIYKKSDGNLDNDQFLDISDHEYYNTNGKLK